MFKSLKEKIAASKKKIVFPEGTDPRILHAACRLQQEDLLEPILLGSRDAILAIGKKLGLRLADLTIIDPQTYEGQAEMLEAFLERRRGKATREEGEKLLQDENYFGTMLVYLHQADGLVSGAVHTTGETVRPALQIIKAKPDYKVVSGAFLMLREEEQYLFADCALNIDPDAETLADIALASADTARQFGLDPRVAMLSFSSKGSAKSAGQEKMAQATKMALERAPEGLKLDGELQFDAAFVPAVAQQKAPNSVLGGKANVFIFPDIQAGNIGYKIAQRLGNFEAIGPILQGMNQPISDLSRGCNEEDVYKLAIITAAQAL